MDTALFSRSLRRTDFILGLQACGLQRGCHVVKITAELLAARSRAFQTRSCAYVYLRACVCVCVNARVITLRSVRANRSVHAQRTRDACLGTKRVVARTNPFNGFAVFFCDSKERNLGVICVAVPCGE